MSQQAMGTGSKISRFPNSSRATPRAHENNEQILPNGAGLRFVALPGHQTADVNNTPFVIITPDGVSFAHTGDQHYSEDLSWIYNVGDKFPVDFIMFNIWAREAPKMVAGFKPKFAVPGHEFEMSHGVDQRKPYDHFYDFMSKYKAPTLVMSWGESFFWNGRI